MPGRIEDVDSPGQHRYRHPVDGERGAVGGTVNSVGPAGDDCDLVFGEPR